jgi:hypothetical protein
MGSSDRGTARYRVVSVRQKRSFRETHEYTAAYREGGFFKAELKFPDDFPSNPPEMKFVTKMWHPNSMTLSGPNAYTDELVLPSY